MQYFVVDAFTDTLFKGNQAGVCLLESDLPAEVMQSIAAENNLAETAFVIKQGDDYGLRWFTPEVEIDLCGHATLASAFIIANFVDQKAKTIYFQTMSGLLTVNKEGDLYKMDFPARKPTPVESVPLIEKALGVAVLETHSSRDLLVVVESEQDVKNLRPDFSLLTQISGSDYFAIIVTAKGQEIDFVSRFFAPNAGILEDPVTGSSHSTLIPFWSERLNKKEMIAKQLSKRGGTLYCQDMGDRVVIAGYATLYLQGSINIA